MDYMKNFQELLKQAMRDMENDMYNGLFEQMFEGTDDGVRKALQTFFHALNKRGVSSKVIFEAVMDVAKEWKTDD